jgi:ferric-dicitrate binding protein FerR (iron transport regulator)
MAKDYTNYTADQLLNDDYFLDSELHPTAEKTAFWQQLEEKQAFPAQEIEIARSILTRIKIQAMTSPIPPEAEKELWERILNANRRQDQQPFRILKIAASIAAAIGLLLVFNWYVHLPGKPETDYLSMLEANRPAEQATDQVQLILSDDRQISVDGKEISVEYKEGRVNVRSEEKTPVTEETHQPETSFNQLIVPAGKRSVIRLDDGTRIWVNSGSKLIYPVRFTGDKREIFAEGEIQLEVSPDDRKPFIVKTIHMEIKVLGTHFNVSAYRDEPETQVVLVSGKVEVTLPGKVANVLKPNQLFSYNDQTGGSLVSDVDVTDYIVWKDGYYQFHRQRLDIVIGKLAKYYGVTIRWNEQLGELSCSGKLDLKEDLDEVFNSLRKAAPIEIEKTNESIYMNVKPKK